MDPDFGVATGPAARTGWSAIDRVGGSYSIRKGSTLLTISYWSPDGEFHLDLLEDAMAWLDQAE